MTELNYKIGMVLNVMENCVYYNDKIAVVVKDTTDERVITFDFGKNETIELNDRYEMLAIIDEGFVETF